MMNNTILFVDDEENILKLLEKAFTKVGYAVKTARSGEKAWKFFKTRISM